MTSTKEMFVELYKIGHIAIAIDENNEFSLVFLPKNNDTDKIVFGGSDTSQYGIEKFIKVAYTWNF